MHLRPSFAQPKRRKLTNTSAFQLLKTPLTEKLNCETVISNGMEIGHSSMQGYRVHMEDEHIIDTMSLDDHNLVAIMDGHSGTFAAELTSVQLKEKIEQTAEWQEYTQLKSEVRHQHVELLSKALVKAYVALDAAMLSSVYMDSSGCTAVSCIITPTHIICANVGDSRCVIGSGGKTISMTEDHKPSNPDERLRIEQGGGFVMMDRVNGELAMSRALGDFRYKNDPNLPDTEYLVLCYPDISIHVRNEVEDEIMILACDGVWDVLSNSEAVEYINSIVLGDKSEPVPTSEEVSSSLIDLALSEGSTDNISAVIVKFIQK
eukprot:gene14457-19403_t